MLINFTVENFRSFRKQVSLRMEATNIRELPECVLQEENMRLLPVAVIYGANSGGKSNVLRAMSVMRFLVMTSSKINPDERLHYDPFKLDLISRNQPTKFEILFIRDKTIYRYGFSYDARQIKEEYLFMTPPEKRAEIMLFLRAEDEYDISEKYFEEGLHLDKKTLPNRLFLTVAAQFNGDISQKVMKCFAELNSINGIEATGYEGFTMEMISKHKDGYKQAIQFFHDTQLGFNNLAVRQKSLTKDMVESLSHVPDGIKKDLMEEVQKGNVMETLTTHNIKDANGKVVDEEEFQESTMESEGTKKIIEMSGPIFDTLIHGEVLLIDELDAKLHPILTRHIVRLFMDPMSNKHNAQLIFNTHDTNLLSKKNFRRDQIWFVEKDKTDSTDLYSLVEFIDEQGKKVRNDSSYEKDYINGRYGAIPFIGGLDYGKE